MLDKLRLDELVLSWAQLWHELHKQSLLNSLAKSKALDVLRLSVDAISVSEK